MRTLIKTLFLASIFIVQGCFEVLINDDGSTSLSSKENLSDFNINDLYMQTNYQSFEEIPFQVINAQNIKEVKSKTYKTWVFVWGSWCKPCIEKLPQLIEIDEQNKDLKILFVAEDYALTTIQKLLYKNNYQGIPYILDSEIYGKNIKEKAKLLNEIICKNCEFKTGFPQNYIYDQNGKMKLYQIGNVSDFNLSKLGIKKP